MRRIDEIGPASFGFNYDRILAAECRFLLSRNLSESSSVTDLLQPVILWRNNRSTLNCKMLGPALYLELIHRLIRINPNLIDADFYPMIRVLEQCNTWEIEISLRAKLLEISSNSGDSL
jgi:hypothetical protein